MSKHISFEKASKALELMLKGMAPKRVAKEVGCHVAQLTNVKEMFPLFLGHPRKRVRKAVQKLLK